MILWVIGAGGLLGSALRRVADQRSLKAISSRGVPWSNTDATPRVIENDAIRLREMLGSASGARQRWGIVWAAGRATTTSTEHETAIELQNFKRSVTAIRKVMTGIPGGTFALASSAGGIYAGSSHPPFNSSTNPMPLGAYGRLNLAKEQAATDLLGSDMGIVIARIANLYGPGQDLGKVQGLISRLALTSVAKEPLTMFVPLDTLRDYITTDDAAQRLIHWIAQNNGTFETRVIASGQATTLGYLINLMKNITRVATPIASGVHESARFQSGDLRLIPDTDDVIADMHLTSLPAGMKVVYEDILWRSMYGRDASRWH